MNALEIAKKMEADAIAFYREASKKTSHAVGKKMFLSIMEDEKRHLKMIDAIIKDVGISSKDVSPMKKIKTIFEELKHEMGKRIKATTDEMEAFKIAMGMEKEGVEFYRKSASGAKNKKEKALFERLIKEEEQHYAVFANSYFFMSDTGSWFMWEEHGIVDGGTPTA
ncbi:MAG: ferritin family protein [Thermodesulfovibrionales bacterium]|nr:ferritin family protein [Thermodesulfovibrionales bacterium]